jgi:tetratricopeptide (TPR) repeat protein
VTGTTLQSKEIQSRAKREMAKVYVQLKKYSKAITLFEQTVDDISVSYDIGKCHLQLRNYEKAREYGLKSSELAKELKDEKWIEKARELVEQASKNEQLPCLPI